MKLAITPDVLIASYELLRTTAPFKRWKLPEADDIEFRVTRHRDRYAHCDTTEGRHTIVVSEHKHAQIGTLIATMAHEMIHIREHNLGVRADVEHGALFQRLAKQVCAVHGFDPKSF